MILIISHKTDFTADFVINKLNQRNIGYKRLNCEDLFSQSFKLSLNNNFEYLILGEENYKSIWFRRTKLPQIDDLVQEEKLYILNETESLFKNLFTTLPGKWLSKPNFVYEAENKILQLKIAQEIGFNIPNTIVTNSRKEVVEFYKLNNENIIVKPISHTRIEYKDSLSFIFTNHISKKQIEEIDNYEINPCIFQENIPKEYEIRVTVVGEKVFAAAVYSQMDEETKIDWRKKKLKFVHTQLPPRISQLCVQLVKKLNLEFGAIDLIKNTKGDFIFLEINPNGQWAWIESQTDLKISEAIIDFLIS